MLEKQLTFVLSQRNIGREQPNSVDVALGLAEPRPNPEHRGFCRPLLVLPGFRFALLGEDLVPSATLGATRYAEEAHLEAMFGELRLVLFKAGKVPQADVIANARDQEPNVRAASVPEGVEKLALSSTKAAAPQRRRAAPRERASGAAAAPQRLGVAGGPHRVGSSAHGRTEGAK